MNHTSMVRNYIAPLDNMLPCWNIYLFLTLRWWSSARELIIFNEMFAFYCMANQLQCQISEVILGGETFCKERLLKKTLSPVKIAFMGIIPTLSRLARCWDHSWLYFRYFEVEVFCYINRLLLKVFSLLVLKKCVFYLQLLFFPRKTTGFHSVSSFFKQM